MTAVAGVKRSVIVSYDKVENDYLPVFKALAGHSYISTAQRYIDVNAEHLATAVELLWRVEMFTLS